MLRFNGSGRAFISDASLGSALDFGATDFAFSLWLRVFEATAIQKGIVGKLTINAGLALYMESDGTITFEYEDVGDTETLTSTLTVDDGKWHFVLCQRDADGNNSIRIDSTTKSAAVAAAPDVDNTSVLTLSSIGSGFMGDVAQVSFYDELVSGANANALYNSGLGKNLTGSESDLVWGTNIDTGSGTSVVDIVAAKNLTFAGTGNLWLPGGVPTNERVNKIFGGGWNW